MSGAAPSRSHGNTTIADVARLAGVSPKSVSRVINAEPHVSARLRAKVEAAIGQLNYVPDTAARSLAGSRAFIIGALFDNPSPNYVTKAMTGVYRACVANRYHMRIDTLDSSRTTMEFMDDLAAVLRNGRTDGFVLTPPLTDNRLVLDFLDRAGVRYVRVAPYVDEDRAPAVRIDDIVAAGEVARHLWRLGHRRFGLINGPDEHGAARVRRQGFLDTLGALGAGRDYSVRESYGGFQFDRGIAAGDELLAPAGERPTAIFATNDDSAAGAMVACSRAGLSVPRDISVVGFDDSWIARSVWPHLTTVSQPIEEMAYVAARMLVDRSFTPPGPQWLEFRLIERASTAPAPAC
ncbi:MAG: LacI family DNA-binding transcriptional regulator [Sphingomonas bacterium]